MVPHFAQSRRQFLQIAGSAILARQLRAIEPLARKGAPLFRLSLAAYSFRDYFKHATHPQHPQTEQRIEMEQFIDYCGEQGCAGAELTSYYFPPEPTDEYLRGVRRHAFLRGVAISGTSVGNNFTLPHGEERTQQIVMVKKWIDRAAVLGAPHIRVFAGKENKGQSLEETRKLCIEALEEVSAYAGEHGIFLGLENHGGIVAEPAGLLEIVRAVRSPWLGINLDSGNFHTADPYASLAECAPYAVNVQVKVEMFPGGVKQAVPADFERMVKVLREANYQGWVALEYEAKEDPWTAVPRWLEQLRPLLGPSTPAPNAELTLFDGKTLAGWKVTEFGGHGEVNVEDGAIVLDAGSDLTGIHYPGQLPKTNYEVELEARREEGGDFFCGLTVPVGEAHCTFVVGGWGGALVGISSIDGEDASENPTTQTKKFEKGRWYKIRMRVSAERIETWIDQEKMAEVSLAGKKISMRPGEIELSKPFGIASFRTRAGLRNIRLRRL